jgi:hypothetical protein
MPGSPTAPGRPGACNGAPGRVAFHQRNGVGTQIDVAFAAQWLAYAIPYRRFAHALTVADARLGADVVCCSFIVVDLHHLLLAGLPAHSGNPPFRGRGAPIERSRESLYGLVTPPTATAFWALNCPWS